MRQRPWMGLVLLVLVGWMQTRAVSAADESRIPVLITVTTIDGSQPLGGVVLSVVDAAGGVVTEGMTDDQGATTLLLTVGGYGLVVGGTLPDGTPIVWEPFYQARGIQPFFVTEAVVPLGVLVAPDGIAVVGVSVIGDPLRGPGSAASVDHQTPPPRPVGMVTPRVVAPIQDERPSDAPRGSVPAAESDPLTTILESPLPTTIRSENRDPAKGRRTRALGILIMSFGIGVWWYWTWYCHQRRRSKRGTI